LEQPRAEPSRPPAAGEQSQADLRLPDSRWRSAHGSGCFLLDILKHVASHYLATFRIQSRRVSPALTLSYTHCAVLCQYGAMSALCYVSAALVARCASANPSYHVILFTGRVVAPQPAHGVFGVPLHHLPAVWTGIPTEGGGLLGG